MVNNADTYLIKLSAVCEPLRCKKCRLSMLQCRKEWTIFGLRNPESYIEIGLMIGVALTSLLVGVFDVKHYFHLQVGLSFG
jgi:hypothetical protein